MYIKFDTLWLTFSGFHGEAMWRMHGEKLPRWWEWFQLHPSLTWYDMRIWVLRLCCDKHAMCAEGLLKKMCITLVHKESHSRVSDLLPMPFSLTAVWFKDLRSTDLIRCGFFQARISLEIKWGLRMARKGIPTHVVQLALGFLFTVPLTNSSCSCPNLRNLMVARTCIYLYILSLLGCCWAIEQPSSSLLEKHVLFQWLCKQVTVYRVT